MGGGLFLDTLTLIEGNARAGKSVISQQLMHGCLSSGYRLALFNSESTIKGLVEQMQNLNLDIRDYLLLRRVRIFPVTAPNPDQNIRAQFMRAVIKEASERGIIFVDSLTSLLSHATQSDVIDLFEEFRRLCAYGATMVVTMHSHGLNSPLRTYLQSLCDGYFQLRTEDVGGELVETLEIIKTRGIEQEEGPIIHFEVEPRRGISVIPTVSRRIGGR